MMMAVVVSPPPQSEAEAVIRVKTDNRRAKVVQGLTLQSGDNVIVKQIQSVYVVLAKL